MDALSEGDLAHLAEIVVSHLRTAPLGSPRAGESERAFTARVIQPSLRDVLSEVGVSGLLLGGDGAAPVQPILFLGRHFFPDVTIAYHDQRALACEVKIFRGTQTQNSLATAVGQASLYREAGYPHSVLCLVDGAEQFATEAVLAASRGFAAAGLLHFVLRRGTADGLEPHPS